MRALNVTVGPLVAASATNIRTASTVLAGGAVVLNGTLVTGGIATLDTPRRVLLTTTADNTGVTVVLTGTLWSGQAATETIAFTASTTYQSVLDYATLTSVVTSAALTGNLSVGTNGVASSSWVAFDIYANPTIGIQIDVSGTANYTVQTTFDDPGSSVNPVLLANMKWFSAADGNIVGATTSQQSGFSVMPVFARILLNSQTNPGFVTGTFVQPSFST